VLKGNEFKSVKPKIPSFASISKLHNTVRRRFQTLVTQSCLYVQCLRHKLGRKHSVDSCYRYSGGRRRRDDLAMVDNGRRMRICGLLITTGAVIGSQPTVTLWLPAFFMEWDVTESGFDVIIWLHTDAINIIATIVTFLVHCCFTLISMAISQCYVHVNITPLPLVGSLQL